MRSLLFALLGLVSLNCWSGTNDCIFTANVEPVRNSKGHLVYSLYDNEEAFVKGQNELRAGKIPAVPGAVQITLTELHSGFYAFTIFHDENDNGKLDTNFLGIPKEMFGISNITQKLWSQPKWNQVKFEIKEGMKNELPVLLKWQ